MRFMPHDVSDFQILRKIKSRAVNGYLGELQQLAKENNGLDYLPVFEDPFKPEALWFIEHDEGGAITALLPSDY